MLDQNTVWINASTDKASVKNRGAFCLIFVDERDSPIRRASASCIKSKGRNMDMKEVKGFLWKQDAALSKMQVARTAARGEYNDQRFCDRSGREDIADIV